MSGTELQRIEVLAEVLSRRRTEAVGGCDPGPQHETDTPPDSGLPSERRCQRHP